MLKAEMYEKRRKLVVIGISMLFIFDDVVVVVGSA